MADLGGDLGSLSSARWDGSADLRALSDTLPWCLLVAGRDGEVIFANVALQRYSGLAASELSGTGWLGIVHTDDRERAVQGLVPRTVALASDLSKYRFRRHDGQFRWHAVQVFPVSDSLGIVSQWIAFCFDVEEDSRRSTFSDSQETSVSQIQEHRASEDIQATIDALPFIVWEADRAGRIERVNAAWHDCVGGPVARQPTLRDVIAPHALGQFLSQWDYSLTHCEIMDVETEIVDRITGARFVKALIVPSWLGEAASGHDRWIGSFSER